VGEAGSDCPPIGNATAVWRKHAEEGTTQKWVLATRNITTVMLPVESFWKGKMAVFARLRAEKLAT